MIQRGGAAVPEALAGLPPRPGGFTGREDETAALLRALDPAVTSAEPPAVLVLADNASSPDQVRSLLPGDRRHRVLVTSRDRLAQLGARLVSLDQLTPEEAYELLDRALRIADPHDARIVDASEAAQQLAVLCGHLPLALQIAVALLAEDPGKPVSELVAELGESHDRLDHLDLTTVAGTAQEAAHRAGDHRREAMTWNNLGLALREAGRVEDAIEAFGKDLEICREFEDWYGEGLNLYNLARTLVAAHRPAEAGTAYLQSADAYTRANAPAEAANARTQAAALDDPPLTP